MCVWCVCLPHRRYPKKMSHAKGEESYLYQLSTSELELEVERFKKLLDVASTELKRRNRCKENTDEKRVQTDKPTPIGIPPNPHRMDGKYPSQDFT